MSTSTFKFNPFTRKLDWTGAGGGGGGGINTINGDDGSVTGATVSFLATPTAGSSVQFSGSGTTMSFEVTDADQNTIIGLDAGNGTMTATDNVGLGFAVLESLTSATESTAVGFLSGNAITNGNANSFFGSISGDRVTTGSSNTALGAGALHALTTGNFNLAVGSTAGVDLLTGSNNIIIGSNNAGNNYNSSESNNICIGNTGVASESNVIRIGTQGGSTQQQNKCYIAGIFGQNTGSPYLATVDSVTGQAGVLSSQGTLGYALVSQGPSVAPIWTDVATFVTVTGNSGGAISPVAHNFTLVGAGGVSVAGSAGTLTISATGGGLAWTDVTGATQTLAINNGYVTNRGGGVAYTLPATATEGDVIRIAGKLGAWTVAQNANQQITIGSTATTVGVGGSLASTNLGDCIELLCTTSGASTIYRVISSMGNITVV